VKDIFHCLNTNYQRQRVVPPMAGQSPGNPGCRLHSQSNDSSRETQAPSTDRNGNKHKTIHREIISRSYHITSDKHTRNPHSQAENQVLKARRPTRHGRRIPTGIVCCGCFHGSTVSQTESMTCLCAQARADGRGLRCCGDLLNRHSSPAGSTNSHLVATQQRPSALHILRLAERVI